MMMGMGGGMDKMAGESMLLGETSMIDTAQQASEIAAEPTASEQIEQIKLNLDWLEEVKDQVDEDIWLNLTTSLEEMLEGLEQE
jgi:hypothetical protein